MDTILRLIDVGTGELNRLLSRFGIGFSFSSQLLTTAFIVVTLCIVLLVTLISDKRSRSIVLVFVFLAMLVAIVLFMLRAWLVMTGRG